MIFKAIQAKKQNQKEWKNWGRKHYHVFRRKAKYQIYLAKREVKEKRLTNVQQDQRCEMYSRLQRNIQVGIITLLLKSICVMLIALVLINTEKAACICC